MPINHWPATERPREKLLARGARTLSNAELLAVLLGSGCRGQSALDLARQLGGDDWANDMELRGDVAYAQRFHAILRALEFDWEEQLSRLVGDVAAHQIGNLARGALSWGSQAAESLSRATTDYLQEEARDLPAPAEVERFMEGVDKLRGDCDRLAARVARLERSKSGKHKPDRA